MASTIAAPVPQPHVTQRPARKDLTGIQLHEEGRSTPLPQYEKTQSVPFALTLQEDKKNPGQFQLVVNIDPENKAQQSNPKPAASKKLYANLQAFPSLGYDVSPLYQTQKSSPPTTPQQEKEWSDLAAIPPDFLQKVVPDWEVTFQRKDSTASTQSRKLADIKARIKKSGKGFVVRLLKGSSTDHNDVAEIHLGQQGAEDAPIVPELGSCPPAELDAIEAAVASHSQQLDIVEIGTSSEPGLRRHSIPAPTPQNPSVAEWLTHTAFGTRARNSILEEGFSDAETLTHEVRSIGDRLEDDQTDLEPFSADTSMLPTRTASISSIVKTPTRGLSVVGPVKRINKVDRARTAVSKGKAARLDLNRSDAKKSMKRRSPHNSIASTLATGSASIPTDVVFQTLRQRSGRMSRDCSQDWDDMSSEEYSTWSHGTRDKRSEKEKVHRRSSAEELLHPTKQKTRLHLQTNVPPRKSPNTSPVNRKKKSPRTPKPRSSSSSVHFAEDTQHTPSPEWSEVDPSEELREALKQAFATPNDTTNAVDDGSSQAVPRIEEPPNDNTGPIPLPPNLEIRSPPVNTRSPTLTFWGLALSSLSEKLFEGLYTLRLRYGAEPAVPPNHVRVRWTCSCGEHLYDDFIEQRPGAARALEAYLNRPRTHAPPSPTGRTSTSSTMSSVFSNVSTASTLATPASTYGGSSLWGKGGDSSRYSPTRLRSSNPFSVRIGSFVEEQWLLTCANEGRFTPKIVHIDVNTARIKSDKDLALALRDHYDQLNRRWMKWARLRGLTTIEFVQFEVHRNRFADIRATPSMPPNSSSSKSSPSEHPYSFEPVDLIPPVGSTYLLHLFQHPSDYDGELITYLRSPKRRERLEFGMGWGINLVEGFLAQKVWTCLMLGFGVGSAVFAILWTVKKGDVQGAFGVAGWVVTLAGLVLGGLQAWLD